MNMLELLDFIDDIMSDDMLNPYKELSWLKIKEIFDVAEKVTERKKKNEVLG